MKTREFLLAMAVILLSGCAAAAPLAMYGGSTLGTGYGVYTMGSVLGCSGNSERQAQDVGGVILYRDAKYAQGIAGKALKNLGIPVEKSDNSTVCGATKDGVEVVVNITEKTPKLTEMRISAKKNGLFTDQVILKMVGEEIKKLAGIGS